MIDLTRRFRGLGIAFVVLALSAGAVFATSPALPSQASDTARTAVDKVGADDGSEAPESEAPESDAPESEAPESDAPKVDAPASDNAPSDNHGALVSGAAQMDTPEGFPNHGAFVSCVAHMKDVSAVGFDYTTVTPELCGITTPDTQTTAAQTKADAGKAKGAAGKAKGHAKHAAAAALAASHH